MYICIPPYILYKVEARHFGKFVARLILSVLLREAAACNKFYSLSVRLGFSLQYAY